LSSNKETVSFLKKLGAKNIKYFGNLKYSQSENEKIEIDSQTIKFISRKLYGVLLALIIQRKNL
jgi:3-deoxy-D-manno-octulosonic-acid transferase